MILVISHPADDHATSVLAELGSMGREAFLFDLSTFPASTSLSMRYGNGSPAGFTLRSNGHGAVDLTACRAAWWRRPQPFGMPEGLGDPTGHAFAYNECHEAVTGLWEALGAFWMNPPKLDDAAAKKSFQLRIAAEAGLEIPKTLITSDPKDALEFANAVGIENTIYKAFSATEKSWRETRLLRPEELDLLDRVSVAPVIFQEYVPAEVDLRVTIVGGRVFPAAIHPCEGSYKADFRMDMGMARYEPAELPPDVEAALLRFMRRLGIVYGAVDMRRTPEGRHVFLEVNPAGQWKFIEERTGQPITRAVAELLAAHDQ